MTIYFLTCADQTEASKIAKQLLGQHLIVCARRVPIDSDYYWKGKIESDQEILLMMESDESKFDKIQTEVAKLHSYEEFVLTSVPVSKTTPGVLAWLKEGLQSGKP